MAGFENYSVSQVDLQANVTSDSTSQLDFLKIFTLSFNFLFGPLIHGCVLWLIVKGKRTELEFTHLNLSVCEVIISISSFINLLEIKFSQLLAWVKFSIGLLTTGRPLFQCLICVELYMAVVHPVTFLKYKPLRYKVACCAAVWSICLTSCLFSLLTVTAHEDSYVYCLLVQFLLYLFINMFCCVAVLRALKQSGPGERGKEREKENTMKAKAFKSIIIVTIAVLILFVPSIVLGCLSVLLGQDVSNFKSASFSCLILAGFVQPGVYLYRNGKLPFFCTNCSFKIQK